MKDNWQDKLRLPIIAAPMFLISNPDMVLACLQSGIVGTFPSLNRRTSAEFDQWLDRIEVGIEQLKEAQKAIPPFGVNLIVHKSNPRLQEDLAICVKHRVPMVITSLGAVKEVVDAVHSYGGKVFHDVTTKRHAQKAIEAGVDGLILVCAGAGGHAGSSNPMAFVREVRSMYDGIIVLAGGISEGRDIATGLQMGADMCYMGTRFINTQESPAPEDYKKMILEAGLDDIVYTARVSGVPANFLKSSLLQAGLGPEEWSLKGKMDFGAEAEAKAWKTIWSAGHGVNAINDVPSISDLVERLHDECEVAIQKQVSMWAHWR